MDLAPGSCSARERLLDRAQPVRDRRRLENAWFSVVDRE